ncbi:hypothetical protein [Micromonospora cremea]|uniref:Uncharacterized protein n=1 Tax=Micromonospora cremea TaxID=709881 RepID=A0A1N5TI63_9ACTN|nr:hypothetical protein [Micromonospora cremea]SIM48130.1 hypothetical protein SAMN04489832_0191 [Micromonospora cremea]
MAVEAAAAGLLPDVVRVPQTGMYVGASDVPAPAVEHLYGRVGELAGEVVYQYRGCRPSAAS